MAIPMEILVDQLQSYYAMLDDINSELEEINVKMMEIDNAIMALEPDCSNEDYDYMTYYLDILDDLEDRYFELVQQKKKIRKDISHFFSQNGY